MTQNFSPSRYASMTYRRCGRSGLLLPAISLGFWHNFGDRGDPENMRRIMRRAFDLGITYFDLANNYGPPPGSAERHVGRILADDFKNHRDELIVATKAGYGMWEGPYGDGGSKKYLVASLDQSLRRLGLDYVDIFYHHRFDPDTPLEETMEALDLIVRQGKALYAAVSNYGADHAGQAQRLMQGRGGRLLANQIQYSMLNRWIEEELTERADDLGVGLAAFSPLAQGLLSDRYLEGIPADSRAADPEGFLKADQVTERIVNKLRKLNEVARRRGQSLAQMALAWTLRRPVVVSALVGVSRPEQLEQNVAALENLEFAEEELREIDEILNA